MKIKDTAPSKKRTITLSGRRPVVIVESEWPIIAHSYGDSYGGNDNARHSQALANGECDRYSICARQHADGRSIVYAVLDAATAWTGTISRREGKLLAAGEDVAAALVAVGNKCGIPDEVIRDAIASLPPEEL